ncbi:MAG: outer membrane beta-barrel protein [Magnetococcales bacterium]|nr:outer membrane beta-barrel protein [Magnetococcales bacterium]
MRRKCQPALYLLLLGALLWSFTGDLRARDEKAKGISIGIFRINPSFNMSSSYSDNILKTSDNRIADKILSFKPVLQITTHWRKLTFSAGYQADVTRHESWTSEDFADQGLRVNASYEQPNKMKFAIEGASDWNHDTRGAPDTGFGDIKAPPKKWRHYSVETKGEYTLNRFKTLLSTSRDINDKENVGHYWDKVAFSVMYAISPKTSLLTELSRKSIHYDDATLKRDSLETGLGAGLTWRATAQTTGEVRVGMKAKSLPDKPQSDTSSTTWDGNVVWKPLRHTSVGLNLNRDFQEGGETDLYFVTTGASLSLEHQVRSFLTQTAKLSYTNNAYASSLENNLWKAGIGVNYQFPRWWTMGVDLSHTVQESNRPGSNYDDNAVMVTFKGGM